jgi:hypothetical protein
LNWPHRNNRSWSIWTTSLAEVLGDAGCQVVRLSTSGTVPSFGSSRRNPRSHRTGSHPKHSLGRLGSHRNLDK